MPLTVPEASIAYIETLFGNLDQQQLHGSNPNQIITYLTNNHPKTGSFGKQLLGLLKKFRVDLYKNELEYVTGNASSAVVSCHQKIENAISQIILHPELSRQASSLDEYRKILLKDIYDIITHHKLTSLKVIMDEQIRTIMMRVDEHYQEILMTTNSNYPPLSSAELEQDSADNCLNELEEVISLADRHLNNQPDLPKNILKPDIFFHINNSNIVSDAGKNILPTEKSSLAVVNNQLSNASSFSPRSHENSLSYQAGISNFHTEDTSLKESSLNTSAYQEELFGSLTDIDDQNALQQTRESKNTDFSISQVWKTALTPKLEKVLPDEDARKKINAIIERLKHHAEQLKSAGKIGEIKNEAILCLTTKMENHTENYFNSVEKSNSNSYKISKLKQELIEIVDKQLKQDPRLTKHRNWATRAAILITNAILTLSIVGLAFLGLNRVKNGHWFFKPKTATEKQLIAAEESLKLIFPIKA